MHFSDQPPETHHWVTIMLLGEPFEHRTGVMIRCVVLSVTNPHTAHAVGVENWYYGWFDGTHAQARRIL